MNEIWYWLQTIYLVGALTSLAYFLFIAHWSIQGSNNLARLAGALWILSLFIGQSALWPVYWLVQLLLMMDDGT